MASRRSSLSIDGTFFWQDRTPPQGNRGYGRV
jgi:hypothetical protein